MIAEKLKKSILKAAFSGVLTQQKTNDNSAFELLKTRKNIIKSHSNLPTNWILTTIDNIGEVVGGGTPKTSIKKYWNGNIPWVTPADLGSKDEVYITIGRRNITELGLEKSSAKLIPGGSVLLSSRAPIGYLGIAANPLSTNQGFKSIVPFNMEMNKYIYYYLMYIRNELVKMGSGTTFKEISGATVKKVQIIVPPLEEQIVIVEKIEKLLPLIDILEEHEKQLKKLKNEFPKRLNQSLLLAAIEGKISKTATKKEEARNLKNAILLEKDNLIKTNTIRKEKKYPVNEDESINVPYNWERIRLEDIVHFVRPNKEKFSKEQIYLDVRSIREENYTKRRKNGEMVYPGNLAILVDGQNSGEIFEIKIKGILGSTLRKIIINPQIHKEYALLILEFYKNKFRDNKRGSAIPHLDFQLLNTSVVPLPSLTEQIEIVNKVNEILKIKIFKE